MGRGAASAFLGIHAGHPGFAMMASSVYVNASTGEIGVDVIAVGHPERSENILQYLEWFALRDSPYSDRQLQEWIAVWLAGRTLVLSAVQTDDDPTRWWRPGWYSR
ncbi:hypothetical protein [Streptomyces canus]|uniref:hypothetical protein n=1 Tax=Streptomyces canus TaxID=58343 RepID=UPI002E26E7D8